MLIGDAVGYPIQVGSDNIGIGYNSLRNITDSAGFTQNIGIGSNTLANDTGSGNTSIGGESGVSITSGTNNTVIGYFAGRSSLATATNSTAIGYKSNFSASNTIALGGTGVDAAKVTIGGTSAAEALDVTGNILASGTIRTSGDKLIVTTAKTPASASDTGTVGTICWDASYIYVCTATNTWKRTAIATW
jgi:hypothetical protein